MRDWYLDPPDYPEYPECDHCEEGLLSEEIGWTNLTNPQRTMDLVLACDECGKFTIILAESDYWTAPEEPITDEEIEEQIAASRPDKCPHGNDWGECGACDHASDLAYDSAREMRWKR